MSSRVIFCSFFIAFFGIIFLTLPARTPAYEINFKPANNTSEFLDLIADPNANIIRSKKDFIARCKTRGTVYAKLSEGAVKAFLENVKFKDGGLSTARFDMVAKELSKIEMKQFWIGFGLDDSHPSQDWENFECHSPGNCKSNIGFVCTSNC